METKKRVCVYCLNPLKEGETYQPIFPDRDDFVVHISCRNSADENALTITAFQKKVLEAIEHAPDYHGVDWYKVAQTAFLAEWTKGGPTSHGSLVRNIILAARKLHDLKLISIIPARDRWGCQTYFSRRYWMNKKEAEL